MSYGLSEWAEEELTLHRLICSAIFIEIRQIEVTLEARRILVVRVVAVPLDQFALTG